jgi:glycosyltransferase involved in cell wall biosynthesis
MRVWLITIGEPLPTDGPQARLLRTGMLASALAEAGHDVVWWSSTFDHTHKRYRFHAETDLSVGYTLHLLHAVAYTQNVSVHRILHHRNVARAWSRWASRLPKPDVIVCALPPLELCEVAVRYGRQRDVPVVLDIRDLWPDVFLDLAPAWMRGLMRFALTPLFAQARRVCAGATAWIGVTPAYVQWAATCAGRPPSMLDGDFPIGYAQTMPPPHEKEAAEDFWRARGVDPTTFIVCFFGTLGRQFDLETVIAAARKLQGKGRPFRFVLCGHGDHAARYQRLASDCENVLFPGWMNATQIWTLMRISAAGLAPYVSCANFKANIPNKPAEYFSARLPVLSGIRGALADLLEAHQCGITYDSADDLVYALIRLHDDPALRRTLSDNAARLYQARFAAEAINAGMIHHLARVCATRHERRVA